MAPWVIAITGASGAIYAFKTIRALLAAGEKVCLIISEPGARVLREELGWSLKGGVEEFALEIKEKLGCPEEDDSLLCFDCNDIGCCLASGSFLTKGMLIVPCSMATLAGIAAGTSRNLIERAADVTIKERRPLVLVPRETPLNSIHLKNMLALAEIGVHIVPPMPAFYFGPRSIDDLVDYFVSRVLNLVGVKIDPSI
ncbi:putative aromatic acid decarboxylase [Thermacetogenium phaeum DSM 12270]|uniref:Flavin prenyltransferase UbiX n=1 Tax=Thermacetogenium phaeum (strain ATCC BAA-254 / DSM 26808 / PB) TaxID=1089553 RepID=K4LIF6_THEPS|nr:flavin prenyltransferase UbiX [Thermacetogenium phaeum]AFV11750.1 putative aromatic acid decarboxylase [Thermacetogenium phaeum DSM 12270]